MTDADRLAHKWVKSLLRSEMVKHGVTYSDLAKRLVTVGVVEEAGALRNRVSRGKFSGAFLFQCLAVIGTGKVEVDLLDYIHDAGASERKKERFRKRVWRANASHGASELTGTE